MKAKMKCSSCGAEIENLNLSWGKKYWLFFIPVMLLGFFPLIKLTFFKGDPVKEMTISQVERRSEDGTTEITGLITNGGSHAWTSVTVEVEFFDSEGKFLDEESEYLRSTVQPGAEEHFKISFSGSNPALEAEGVEMKVKIAGGHSGGL